MNKLAIISGFLGGQKNRYMVYEEDRNLEEKFKLASEIKGIDGLELCYPADFGNFGLLKKLLSDYGFGVSSINVRSRRTGKWWRGSFSSASTQERQEVVDDFKRAIDMAVEMEVGRISTCPLNDGHDYIFEINYIDAYRYAEETFAAICEYNRDIKLSIEYKWNDPRVRCLFASAGETAIFCEAVQAPNLGTTLDVGHSIQTGERPAQAATLLARANRLFYIHLNDNDRNFDWDLMPGAFHFWEFVEFFYYLKELGYTDDWYSFDIMSKEIDTVETHNTAVSVTRKLERIANDINRHEMNALLNSRNPAKSLLYMYENIL